MHRVHRPAALAVALLLALGTQAAAHAQPQSANPVAQVAKVRLDVPAGPLGSALTRLALQTGLQISYPPEMVQGKRCEGLSGEHAPSEALTRLLAGTGLRWEAHSASMVVLKEEAPAARPARAVPRADADKAVTNMPEILVSGSRSLNLDIRRTEDDPQPYVVFQREQIEQSLSVDLEDFLKTRLPMNAVRSSNNQAPSTLGNQSQVNLRGLGTAQTLILVDGRRMQGGFTGAGIAQADINGIPLAAIERIEVLPSTASGIYGGGATGGVINIILRRDYSGGDVKLTYENSLKSDVTRGQVDVRAGFSLEDGRTDVMVAASYSNGNPLMAGERDFLQRSRAMLLQNNPAAIYGAATPPLGYTSNIRSANGSPLVLKDGTALGATVTHVPVGYAGPASDGGAALVANAGRYNLDLADSASNSGSNAALLANPRKLSVIANVRREFSDRFEAFLDVSHLDNESRSGYAGFPLSVTLQPTAPDNPFTGPIVVTLPASSFRGVFVSQSKTQQATLGGILKLGRDWVAGLDYTRGRAEQFFSYQTRPITTPGYTALANGTLNPLRDVNRYPNDYSPYLEVNPNAVAGPTRNNYDDLMLRLAGPLMQLPAGAWTLTTLLERRGMDVDDSYRFTYQDGVPVVQQLFPSRSQRVNSAYVESRIPLFGEANARPGLRELEVQASVRYDDYSTVGASAVITIGSDNPIERRTNRVDSTDSTLGLRYVPLSGLTFRASYGTGFQPPSVNDLIPFSGTGGGVFTPVLDPLRGNTLIGGTYTVLSGGNPDIQPEKSKSRSVGLIAEPTFWPGFRLSLDYTRIEKTGEMAALSEQMIVNNEAYYPGRVVRGPRLPSDPQGWAGPITQIDNTLLNVSTAQIAAYDLQMDYGRDLGDLGRLDVFVAATRQTELVRRVSPVQEAVNYVGYAAGPLKWRGNFGATWSRGPWSLAWNATYFDAYFVYAAGSSVATIAAATLNQGQATVPSQTYHDLTARYRFPVAYEGAGWLDNVEVTLGVRNLFNRRPPILAINALYGFQAYSTYADPRMQLYTLSIQKSF